MVEGYLGMVREKVFMGRKVELEDVGLLEGERSVMPVSDGEMDGLLSRIKEVILK
jgi:hypothetical protein